MTGAMTLPGQSGGGSGERPSYADGLAACAVSSGRFEADLHDGALHDDRNLRGWVVESVRVSCYHAGRSRWCALASGGAWRRQLARTEAALMMLDGHGGRMRNALLPCG